MAYLRTTADCPWYVYWVSTGYDFPSERRKEQMVCIDCTDYISYTVAKKMFDASYIQKVYNCSKKHAELLRKGLDDFVADVEARIKSDEELDKMYEEEYNN